LKDIDRIFIIKSKFTNNFSREYILNKMLSYDSNTIIREIQGYCEIQVFTDNPPSKHGVNGGLIKKITDVL